MPKSKSNALSLKKSARTSTDLAALAITVRDKYANFHRRNLTESVDIGRDLKIARAGCKRGEWGPWLDQADIPQHTAERMMKLVDEVDEALAGGEIIDNLSIISDQTAVNVFLERGRARRRQAALPAPIDPDIPDWAQDKSKKKGAMSKAKPAPEPNPRLEESLARSIAADLPKATPGSPCPTCGHLVPLPITTDQSWRETREPVRKEFSARKGNRDH